MIKKSSVKAELWRLILVPALSITLLLAGTLTYLYTSQLAGFMNDRGRLLAEKTSHLAYIALSTNNQELLQEIINATLEEPHVRAVHIYDDQQQHHHHGGPQFLAEGENTPNIAMGGNASSTTIAEAIHFSFPITDKDQQEQIGTLEIEMITSPFQVLLYQTLLIVVLATIACLLLASYLAIKLHHSITHPVEHIQKVVRKLTNGQLGSRADTRLPFELAQLSEAINTMAGQLEQDQEEMQSNINQSMDDLRETMETIEIQNIELDIARKEALAASRIKSEFLANTSHEIRTPLNGIIGFTNLALKTSLDNQQRGYLQTIQDSATNLLKIINDILDFSKIESGKLVLDYLPLHLRQTIEQAVDSLAFDSQEKNIQIVTMIDNNIPPQLMGDPQRFKQLIANLLSNAIKFSPRGTVSITADLVQFEENQITFKVTVSDEGIGLDEEIQKNLFGSFTQADTSASRKHSGAGLGLAICKGLVERMNGEIGVNSVPDQGTSFWFTVRMDVDSHYTAPEQNALKNRHLLICAENKINYLQLQSLTESWQASTQRIETIHELFPTLRKQQQSGQPCHLLILDIAPEERKLPPRLLSNIAEQLDHEFSCKMIVCCTPAHMQLFQHHNTDRPLSFVKKPITQNELLGAINTNLNIQTHANAYQPAGASIAATTDKKVLIVDDNKANLQLASELLKSLNVETKQAHSGSEALAYFTEDVFDAVFMDIQMPGMDGLEATRRLRLLDQQRNIRTPIIALTAHSLTEQKTDLLLAGFDDCLRKPVDEAQLAHVLSRWTGTDTYQSPLRRITLKDDRHKPKDSYHPVNIEQCLSLANHKPDLARDMLVMLVDGLEDDKRAIQEALEKRQFSRLQEHIHRLYGSSCYCGVPILRSLTGLLDKILQSGQYDNVTQVVVCTEKAIEEIQDWAKKHNINTIFSQDDTVSCA